VGGSKNFKDLPEETEEQPEPDAVHVRVGRNACDYTLFEDTVSI